MLACVSVLLFFFFKQKTAYEMRISDWSSDVCSSDLGGDEADVAGAAFQRVERRHLGQPEVAVDAIELGEQRLVAFGGGHRRITAGVEGEGGAGARRMVGDDRRQIGRAHV